MLFFLEWRYGNNYIFTKGSETGSGHICGNSIEAPFLNVSICQSKKHNRHPQRFYINQPQQLNHQIIYSSNFYYMLIFTIILTLLHTPTL